jgi:RNA polymerase sigma factor (sigma-70 family)
MMADRGDDAQQIELRLELIARHRDAFAWALNCCHRNRTDAEDALQETYLKVLDGRARFDRRSTFTTWLFGVLRLTAADQRRRRFLHDLVSGRAVAEDSFREPAPSADVGLDRAHRRASLEQALAALPRRQREVVLLVFYHELTVEDAARVMSIGVGSARQHYARGKAHLREALAQLKETR